MSLFIVSMCVLSRQVTDVLCDEFLQQELGNLKMNLKKLNYAHLPATTTSAPSPSTGEASSAAATGTAGRGAGGCDGTAERIAKIA